MLDFEIKEMIVDMFFGNFISWKLNSSLYTGAKIGFDDDTGCVEVTWWAIPFKSLGSREEIEKSYKYSYKHCEEAAQMNALKEFVYGIMGNSIFKFASDIAFMKESEENV